MAKKKGLYAQLTTISRSKVKSETPVYQRRVGIEAKLNAANYELFELIGRKYQSWLRTGLEWIQNGMSLDGIEKKLQRKFDIDWAWADSIATLVKSTYQQLQTAKENRITHLENDLESGWKAYASGIEYLEELISKFQGKPQQRLRINKRLMGLQSSADRLVRKQHELTRLKNDSRLHITFGSNQLFHTQYHLEENGYSSHEEWLADWRKKRSGNFYAVGKGSVDGNNPICQIHYVEGDLFSITIKPPRRFGLNVKDLKYVSYFEVDGQRKQDLLYALAEHKPCTVQVFRREEKGDQWYIHVTTYVQVVPRQTSIQNGCIGIDLNAESSDIIHIKRDGNKGKIIKSYPLPQNNATTGQREAYLRDICADIVAIASKLGCPIACENLDFSKKKSQMRHSGSPRYNRMLSGFVYDKFRTFLVSRAEKFGVEIKFVSPYLTSVIGMLKYMSRYGLNSATAAAMVIARKAIGFVERLPKKFELSNVPEAPAGDTEKGDNREWLFCASILSKHKITRHRLFDLTTVLWIVSQSGQATTKVACHRASKSSKVASKSKVVTDDFGSVSSS